MMESSTLRTKWAQLSRREQAMVTIAALLLGVTLLWSVGLKPALSTLRTAPSQRDAAQATQERLQSLALEATQLRSGAAAAGVQADPMRTQDSGLDDATRALVRTALGGSANLEAQGRFVTVTFDGASADQLRQALRALRSRLRAQLVEAELTPTSGGVRGRLQFEWTAS
jgi:general secretion pathway protein M